MSCKKSSLPAAARKAGVVLKRRPLPGIARSIVPPCDGMAIPNLAEPTAKKCVHTRATGGRRESVGGKGPRRKGKTRNNGIAENERCREVNSVAASEGENAWRLSHGGVIPGTSHFDRNATLQLSPPNRSNTSPTIRATQAATFRQPPPGRGNVPASLGPIPPKNQGLRQHPAARPGFAERFRPLPPALERRFTSSAGRPFLLSGSGPCPNPLHSPQPA